MEKVYADQSLGYTYGPFPKPWVKITKSYSCPTPRMSVDTVAVDTLDVPVDTAATAPVTTPPPSENPPGEENPDNKTPNPR